MIFPDRSPEQDPRIIITASREVSFSGSSLSYNPVHFHLLYLFQRILIKFTEGCIAVFRKLFLLEFFILIHPDNKYLGS